MDERKIFLAKLAQGAIGEENAYLLGTLLVAKLNQLALSRQEQKESERQNFYLYIDEFQNFITPSMASILSGARKYRLALILAHQDLRQLSSEDTQVASAVISNPYTRVCFRLGDFDARKLAEGFSFFDAKDLQNLGTGEAICRIERAEYDFNLKTLPLSPIEADLAEQKRDRLLALSREKYATPRAEVEEMFTKQSRTKAEPEPEAEAKPRRGTKERPYEQGPPLDEQEPSPGAEETVSKPKRPLRKQPQPIPPESPMFGKGGRQHKYLQDMIKRLAEDKGFKSTIEKAVLGGKGSVDVALERNGRAVACEISVSTNSEQELGNIQKCLAAGFETVLVISPEKKNLAGIRDAVESSLEKNQADRIRYLNVEDFLGFLDEEDAKAATKEQTVKGYKVKVKYRALGESERKSRQQAIAQTILQSMKRMREKD